MFSQRFRFCGIFVGSSARGLALLALLIAATTGPEPVRADGSLPGGRRWAAGIIVASSPSPFVDHPTQVLPVPLVGYFGERVTALGPELNVRLFHVGLLEVSGNASFRWEGFDPEEGSMLDGMVRRKGAFELGARAGLGPIFVKAAGDVSGTHRGQEATLGLEMPVFGGRRWMVEARLGLTYKTQSLVDYYYGVRGDESRVDRPSYVGDDAYNLTSGLNLSWQLNWNWLLLGGIDAERLSFTIADSPIVEGRYEVSGHVGVLRMF